MTKKAWLEKFREAVVDKLSKPAATKILAVVQDGESLSRVSKAQRIADAIERLEQNTDRSTAIKVLQCCSCEFSQLRIAAIKKLYRESANLTNFWSLLKESGVMFEEFELVDGWMLITKKPYRPDFKERMPEKPFQWYCHCGSIVKPLKGRAPALICECSAGFYQPLFKALFGKAVHTEVRASLVRGDSNCLIAIRIPDRE